MLINDKPISETERFAGEALEHIDIIYRHALHMIKNESDAKDLVQETYLRAYRFFDKFREGTNCRAWLLAILKNSFLNTIRRERKYLQTIHLLETDEYEIEFPDHDDLEDTIFGSLLNDDVTIAMNSLPAKYRIIVLLADIEGFSYKEIADKINCPLGTVMSRLNRGRNLLRNRLKAYALQHGYEVNEN
jgi:RNA polymerase sigma-70 factor (ECF subfamily)